MKRNREEQVKKRQSQEQVKNLTYDPYEEQVKIRKHHPYEEWIQMRQKIDEADIGKKKETNAFADF